MRIKRGKRRRKSFQGFVIVLAFVLLGATSFGLAYLWQGAQDSTAARSADASPISGEEGQRIEAQLAGESLGPLEFGAAMQSVAQQVQEQLDLGSENSEEEQESSAEEGESSQEEEERLLEDDDANPAKRPHREGAVPQTTKVDNSYFNDAIFFGDSLSTGIPLYQVAGNPDTVAFTGINPDSINTSAVIPTQSGKKTVLEAAKDYGDKKKVYIMLGANGLWMDDDSFVKGYKTFVDSVKAQYPGAIIYLQSILPVTTDAYLNYETANNDRINEFNDLIFKLAGDSGVHYLDVAHALMNENGALPKEASPMDGMHLTPEYYNKWFEYLKTHTVEVKNK